MQQSTIEREIVKEHRLARLLTAMTSIDVQYHVLKCESRDDRDRMLSEYPPGKTRGLMLCSVTEFFESGCRLEGETIPTVVTEPNDIVPDQLFSLAKTAVRLRGDGKVSVLRSQRLPTGAVYPSADAWMQSITSDRGHGDGFIEVWF